MMKPMETPDQKVLVYDDYCPLCSLYTMGFVSGKMIDARVSFSSIPEAYSRLLDVDRARHEIPYIDTESGKVCYGIDALAEALGNRLPWLKPTILWQPIYQPLKLLYKFISFNRHVIIPSSRSGAAFDCSPDFNRFWRACFIVAAFALSTILTGWFIGSFDGYVSTETMVLSGSIAGGKWAIQMVFGWCVLDEKRWLYLGQLAATCLTGSLILIPFAILSGGPVFFFGSLLACIVVMIASAIIRLKAIGLSWRWPTLWLALLAVAVGLQLTVVFNIL